MASYWYALRSKQRKEEAAWKQALAQGFEAFYPRLRVVPVNPRSRRLVPYFPGYLFVHICNRKDAFLPILKTPGVVKFLSSRPGPPDPVPDSQIASLKNLVAAGKDIEPYPYLQEGRRVRIKWGPLTGVEGILVEKRGQHMLVLSIDILQQGASVRIDAADVEPA